MDYYGISPSSDFFAHYGTKGMKWGIRRYQKADGSLTAKGKARVVKSGSYLNPSNKGKDKKHTENRKKVSDAYVSEWNAKMYKANPQYDPVKNPLADYGPSKLEKRIWDKYKTQYASATLKDLRLKDTKKARDSVSRIFNDTDSGYKYNNPDALSDEKERAYSERKKKLAHPTREKIKKIANNLGLKDAVKSAGLSLVMGPMAANYVTSKRIANEPQKKKKGNK